MPVTATLLGRKEDAHPPCSNSTVRCPTSAVSPEGHPKTVPGAQGRNGHPLGQNPHTPEESTTDANAKS